MELYLMRHGIAVAEDIPGIAADADRPLSPKGIKRTRKAAKGLLALKLSFDRILTSPLARAQQTARIVAEAFRMEEQVQEIPELAPGGSVQKLLSSLATYKADRKILIVGHQPLLGELASFLLSGAEKMEIRLKKGGLCCLEVADLQTDKPVTLHWLLTPRQLRSLED